MTDRQTDGQGDMNKDILTDRLRDNQGAGIYPGKQTDRHIHVETHIEKYK